MIFGLIGTLCISLQLIPQIYKSIKTKTAQNISYLFILIGSIGTLSWLIYGVLLIDYWIIFTNFIILINFSILFLIKINKNYDK